MLIGFDASRAFVPQRTGVENYSKYLLEALLKLKSEHRFVVYLKNELETAHLSASFKKISWPRFWTQGGLALETWLNPPDLLFIPAHTLPFFKNPQVKTVVTVHDLWTQDLPQSQNPIQRMYLNLTMEKLRAQVSAHLITVSEATKKDIVELLGVPSEKVSVVYEGVDHGRFAPDLKVQSEKLKIMRQKYGIKRPYLLFVGTIQPRKNLVKLVHAFSLAAGKGAPGFQLIIAGKAGWKTDEIYAAPAKFGVGERVKFIDYVSSQDLPYLYAGAYALVMPSLHEGFGLPVLESMAVGTPVVVSQISSLPEVAGKAGIYVNPKSAKDVAKGILQVLDLDGAAYQFKSQACIQHAQKFSWERTAEQSLEVFEKVLASA